MWKEASVREIAVVLLIKLVLLYGIWITFFHHSDERELTLRDVGRHMLGESRKEATPSSSIRLEIQE